MDEQSSFSISFCSDQFFFNHRMEFLCHYRARGEEHCILYSSYLEGPITEAVLV